MILLPLTSHEWWRVSWVDWAQVIGVVAAVVALGFTFWQARAAKVSAGQAKVAAEAASHAVDRTQRQVRANQVLIVLPQLRWIAQELDSAIKNDNGDLARRHMDSWRWQAGHANGLLAEANPSGRKILKALQDSVALATEATTMLMKQEKSVMASCERARSAINEACHLVNVYVGQNSMQVQQSASGTEKPK